MIWKNVLCVLAAAVWCANGEEVAPLSELVRSALERNRELAALRRRVDEARALMRQAGIRPAPALEIEGATGRPLGTRGEEEYSAAWFYPIETGGKRGKRTEVARKSVALAEAELDQRARQLAFEVKMRYIEAAAEQQRAAALDRMLGSARDALRLMEARVAKGDAAPLERELLIVDMNRVEAQRAAAAGRLDAAWVELESLTGGRTADSLQLAADSLRLQNGASAAIEVLKKRALASRPDLRIARLLEEQGAAEVGLSEAQGRPDVTVSAKYSRRNAQFDAFGLNDAGQPAPLRDRDNIVAFGISVPLFTRSRNARNIEAAGARAAAARLHREHLERTIPLEVEAAWRRWEAARRTADLLDTGVVRQSGRNLEVIRRAYDLGQLRMLDVLNEQRRMIETEMARIDAASESARAWVELERAAGGDAQ